MFKMFVFNLSLVIDVAQGCQRAVVRCKAPRKGSLRPCREPTRPSQLGTALMQTVGDLQTLCSGRRLCSSTMTMRASVGAPS